MIPDVKSTVVSGGLGMHVLVHVLFWTWFLLLYFLHSYVLLFAYTYSYGRLLFALLVLVSFGQITCPNTPLGWTRSVPRRWVLQYELCQHYCIFTPHVRSW
ncbi:hypothetical protein BKA58DRAFT_210175 [Alternaria rosae]|uniref:uncharacterized protein n=1 Tax=Alternaria rosae TaxID=1187941 RepID=UPI001E8CEADE|nr:uncharacterized protein BKA58DRAFT_210175 [Alternaria rosae]KAH6866711.1 hypothetical protein BKA58DRAFT_210175 [Alternaria rosae]